MSQSFKVSRENIRKVEDYLRAVTLEKGVVSASMVAIARDTGMSSATVFRAINALRSRGLVSVTPAKRPGFPQSITYLPVDHDVSDDNVLRVRLDKIRMALSELEVELEKMTEENKALHEETAIYRSQNARVESRTEMEDGRVMLITKPLTLMTDHEDDPSQ